jgi:hypothetical protein
VNRWAYGLFILVLGVAGFLLFATPETMWFWLAVVVCLPIVAVLRL